MPIDPLSIASLGRITSNPLGIVMDGIGYYVFVEEEIVIPPDPPPPPIIQGSSGDIPRETITQKVKKITIRVCTDEFGEYTCKEHTFTETNVNVTTQSVSVVDKDTLKVTLKDINVNETIERIIKVNVSTD